MFNVLENNAFMYPNLQSNYVLIYNNDIIQGLNSNMNFIETKLNEITTFNVTMESFEIPKSTISSQTSIELFTNSNEYDIIANIILYIDLPILNAGEITNTIYIDNYKYILSNFNATSTITHTSTIPANSTMKLTAMLQSNLFIDIHGNINHTVRVYSQ